MSHSNRKQSHVGQKTAEKTAKTVKKNLPLSGIVDGEDQTKPELKDSKVIGEYSCAKCVNLALGEQMLEVERLVEEALKAVEGEGETDAEGGNTIGFLSGFKASPSYPLKPGTLPQIPQPKLPMPVPSGVLNLMIGWAVANALSSTNPARDAMAKLAEQTAALRTRVSTKTEKCIRERGLPQAEKGKRADYKKDRSRP